MPRPENIRKKKSLVQKSIEENLPPLLKKPIEVVGENIGLPGEYWGTSALAREKDKIFMCTVMDFRIAHREGTAPPKPAMLMHEMGTDGGGGNSADFWVFYPMPFLTYYYQTFPDKLVLNQAGKDHSVPDRSPGGQASADSPGGTADAAATSRASTEIYKYLTFV